MHMSSAIFLAKSLWIFFIGRGRLISLFSDGDFQQSRVKTPRAPFESLCINSSEHSSGVLIILIPYLSSQKEQFYPRSRSSSFCRFLFSFSTTMLISLTNLLTYSRVISMSLCGILSVCLSSNIFLIVVTRLNMSS